MPKDPAKIKALYDAVHSNYDVGTLDEFSQKLDDPNKRQALYNAIGHEYDLGDYSSFNNKLGYDSKEVMQQQVPRGTSAVANPSAINFDLGATVQDIRKTNQQISNEAEYKKQQEFANRTAPGYIPIPSDNPQQIEQATKRDEALQKGYEVVGNTLGLNKKDVPTFLNENTEIDDPTKLQQLSEVKKNTPIAYGRLSPITNLQFGIAKKAGTGAANAFNDLQNATGYNDFINKTHQQQQIINQVYGENSEQSKLLAANKAPLINPYDKGLQQSYFDVNNPLKGIVNEQQYAGLETLKLFEPEKYNNYVKMLQASQGVKWADSDYKAGIEGVKKELEDIGIDNSIKYIQENQEKIINQAKTATPEQIPALQDEYKDLQSKYEDIALRRGNYPTLDARNMDRTIKELLQSPDVGMGKVFPYAVQKNAVDEPLNSLQNIITNLLGSGEDVANLNLTRRGEAENTYDYLPESYRSEASKQVFQFPKSVQDEAQKIQSDNTLDDNQKYLKLSQLIRDNRDKISMVENPLAGKRADFFSKATLYHNAKTLGDIAGIALSSAGLGLTGKAGKAISAAVPMFLSAQNDYYKQAVEEGDKNPMAYANVHATIAAAAGLINPDLSIAKKALGLNTVAGKILAGVDENTWNKVVAESKPFMNKLGSAILGGAKEVGKFAAIQGAGQSALNDLADKYLFNKNITTQDIFDHAVKAFKDVAINSLAVGGIHSVLNFNKSELTPIEKNMMFSLSSDPENTIADLNDAVKKDQISQADANAKISAIEGIAKLRSQVPEENVKGKALTHQQQEDYLFNLFNQEKAKGLQKSLPEAHQEKLTEVQAQADEQNNIIFSDKTEKQLESQKVKLEKQLDEKDDDGENVLQGKDRAIAKGQLNAITVMLPKKTGKEMVGEKGVTVIEPTVRPSENINVQMPAQVGKPNIVDLKTTANEKTINAESQTEGQNVLNSPQSSLTLENKDAATQEPASPLISTNEAQKDNIQQPSKIESSANAEANKVGQPTSQAENKITEPINTNQNASTPSEEQQQASLQQSGEPEYARTQSAGSEAATPSAESGDSNIGSEGEEKITGIKKAITDPHRVQMALPSLDIPKLGKDSEILQQGKDLVDSGKINPRQMVNDINTSNKALNADEASALQYYMHQLGQAGEDIRQVYYDADKEAASKPTDVKAQEDKLIALDRLNQHNDEMANALDAAKRVQNTWGKVGNVMQVVADKAYNPVNIRREIEANYGGETPKSVQNRIDAILKERDEATKEVANLKTELAKLKEEIAAGKNTTKTKKTKTDYKAERDEIVKNIKEKWKNAGKDTLQMSVPYAAQFAAIAPDVLALFKSYAGEGYERVSDIVNKIYDDLKGDVNIPKEYIHGIIADSQTEKLNKQAEQKEDRLATGNIRPRKADPKVVKLTEDLARAQQRVANADFKIRNEQRKAFESQKSKTQRALAWAIRWNRRLALSGLGVVQKIATAGAIGDAAVYPIREGNGWIWSKIFPSIAKGAPIEGGFNAEAMANYYKRIFNLKKSAKNAKDIFLTGSTDLSKRLKEETHEHYAGYDALMDVHSILKDPFKEAEFNSAVTKATKWAANQGWDISDPLTSKFIETMAFSKAQEAIFNEGNEFTNKVRQFVGNNSEQTGKIGAGEFITNMLMPVGKVPTNIIKQLGWGVYGIPKGLYQARKMLKEGVENFTPEQKDAVLKLLKAGTIGNALLTVGALTAYSSFGGIYNQFDKSKRKKNEVQVGESKLGNFDVPKYAEHALPMQLLQAGATFRRIMDYYRSKGENIPQAIGTGVFGTGWAVVGEIPAVNLGERIFDSKEEYGREKLVNSIAQMPTPQMIKDYAKSHDVDANGNPIVRKPKSAVEAFEMTIPGLRENVGKNPVRYVPKNEEEKPVWQILTNKGIDLPKTNVDEIKLRVNGKLVPLTDAQKDEFADIRLKRIEKLINANSHFGGVAFKDLPADKMKIILAKFETAATNYAKAQVKK